MKNVFGLLMFTTLLLSACISDDFVDDRVDPVLRILNPIDSLAIDSTYQFNLRYLNNVGKEQDVEVEWSSSNDEIISVSSKGLLTALAAGSSEISIDYGDAEGNVMDSHIIGVGERTIVVESTGKKGKVNTTSSYKLTGDFTLEEDGNGGLKLEFGADYEASTALPGLFVYLSNNPNTISGAHEIQAVEVFEGAHSYSIPNVGLNDYGYVLYFCKPFNVKVGHGDIEE